MSLLLAARARKHVVVLTDGISLEQKKEDAEVTVEDEDLVKIFPSGKRPYAMVHHGENRLGSLTVGTVLGGMIPRKLDPVWSAGLNRSIAETINILDSTVSQRLKSAPQRKISGFWLAGLWPCTDVPEIAEVAWTKIGQSRVRVVSKPLGDLSMGGSGATFLKPFLSKPFEEGFTIEKIFGESVEFSFDYLKGLYAFALKRQKEENKTLFGGTTRMALITEDGIDLDTVEIG